MLDPNPKNIFSDPQLCQLIDRVKLLRTVEQLKVSSLLDPRPAPGKGGGYSVNSGFRVRHRAQGLTTGSKRPAMWAQEIPICYAVVAVASLILTI
jgi:hypothetical protein